MHGTAGFLADGDEETHQALETKTCTSRNQKGVRERLHEVIAICYSAKAIPKGLPLSLTRARLSGHVYSAKTTRSEMDL